MPDVASCDANTIPAAFQYQVRAQPESVALRTLGGTVSLTWREYGNEVERIAGGLAALGLRRGDTMAALLSNRLEFNLTEMAANHLGVTTFSIYNTSSPEQVAYYLENSAAKVVVTEQQLADKVQMARTAAQVLVVEDGDLDRLAPDAGFDFDSTWRAVQPDDVLCLIYTSGTTGPPKGVEHTHGGFIGMARSHVQRFPITPADRAISYLPTAHLADRGILYYFHSIYGAQITTVADMAELGEALAEVRPTTFAAVPRVWEKLKQRAVAGVAADQDLKAAFDAGDPDVMADVRAMLGLDQLRWALSGSATMNLELLNFLRNLGVPTTDLWGMSEVGIALAAAVDEAKPGTVGVPMSGYEMKLLNDGELLVRSPWLMKGYRSDPAKTAEAVDGDGWMHTGDIFTVDDDGYYAIVDKKKELIISSGGKNMSPTNIEAAVREASGLVGPIMAYGDNRPYNVALITVDAGAAQYFVRDPHTVDYWRDAGVIDEVSRAVATGNARLSRVEQIKRFVLVPHTWEADPLLMTPTGKLKRRVLNERYAADIERLYAAPLAVGVYEPADPSVG
jgi:long-subunit acyl-CoA synthetase (AMP-forming)